MNGPRTRKFKERGALAYLVYPVFLMKMLRFPLSALLFGEQIRAMPAPARGNYRARSRMLT